MESSHKMKGDQVLDGSEIRDLVENKEVFSSFVDHKFKELDSDQDGKLSVKELQPAVADIGIALGLPAQGTSPESDHIYSEVLNEFTHGKERKVSKTEFKEVLSDILLGMAAGLKRDPVVILRIDGEDLSEFIDGAGFQPEAIAIHSHIESPERSLREYITLALEELKVDHGMPPSSDAWVVSNVVEPALESCGVDQRGKPVSQEAFLEAIAKVLKRMAELMKEQPVIVAHSENTFDGSGIRRLLANQFELEKSLDKTWIAMAKDKDGKVSKDYIRLALDGLGPAAGLPPYGAIDQMVKVIDEVLKMADADNGKVVGEDEFKQLMKEILGSIMLQLEGDHISIYANSVVHEPLSSPSVLLPPTAIDTLSNQ